MHSSDGHVVRCALLRRDASLVVDLGCCDVSMPEEVLHLPNVLALLEEERRSRRAKHVGVVAALLSLHGLR